MIDIRINGVLTNYKVGFNIQEHLNETLDSGVLVIPQSSELQLEPLDKVTIEGDYNKQMVISNIKATISRFQSPRLYNYELSLISPTIQLQRIVLPNRSITQPINSAPKTIYTVLQGYLDIYAPMLSLDDAFIAKTDTVVCPEWQWNMPTLFEVFNDLLSAVDCVVTMPTFDTISLLDLNKQGNPIDVNQVNNVEYNFGVEGYADRMEIEAKNVANKQRNAQMYDVVVPKSEESIVTVSNALFILAKPIFEINSARIVWRRKNTVGGDVYLPAATVVTDITSHIVEQAVYDTYKVSNKTGIESGIDYKRNALYYVEGDNKIRGLGYREDTWLPMIDSKPSLINILASVEGYTYQEMQMYTTNVNDILEMGLLVQYTTIEDVKFASLKTKGTKNRSTLINNQNTTYVDISALSISQQQNVDRIGNQEMQIYGRCQNESQVPKTADYIDDYKVTARVVKFDASWLEFTAKLSKNYVIKEMFTGLNSKRRYLQFAQANDAFLSNHLQVLDFNFQNENSEVENQMTDYFMQIGQNAYRPNIAVVKTRSATNVPIATVGLSSSTSIIENGLIYNFKFDDNINAGYKVTKESELLGNVLKVNNTPYVDDRGEFKTLEYFLFRDILNPNFARGEYEGAPEALARARNYPSIDENHLNYDFLIYQSGSLLRHKDNREITSETLQFHFTSEPNIYVYKRFYEYNPLYYNGDNVIPIKIVLSGEIEGNYNKFDTKGKNGTIVNAVIEGNSIRADFAEGDWNLMSWVHAWAVIDNDNNLILANNGRRRYIYLVRSIFSITMSFKTELAITQLISMIPLNVIDIEAYAINSDVDLNEGQSESSEIDIVEDMSYYLSYMTLNKIDMLHSFSESHSISFGQDDSVEVTATSTISFNIDYLLMHNIDLENVFTPVHDIVFGPEEYVNLSSQSGVTLNIDYLLMHNVDEMVKVFTSEHNIAFGPEEFVDLSSQSSVTFNMSLMPLINVNEMIKTFDGLFGLTYDIEEAEVAEIVQSIALQMEVNYLHTMRLIKTFSPEIIMTEPQQATAWVEVAYIDWVNASENGIVELSRGRACPTITSSNAGNPTNYSVDFVMAVSATRLCDSVEICPPQGYISCGSKYYKAV